MGQSNRELHIEMWTWLMVNPDAEKYNWPRWKSNGGDVTDTEEWCFACKEDLEKSLHGMGSFGCHKCPIMWGKSTHPMTFGARLRHCGDNGSVFKTWLYSKDRIERMTCAEKIRDAWPEEKADEEKT